MVTFRDVKYTEVDWSVAHEYHNQAKTVVEGRPKEKAAIWEAPGDPLNKGDLSTLALASLEQGYWGEGHFDKEALSYAKSLVELAQLRSKEGFDPQFPGLRIVHKGKLQELLVQDLQRLERRRRLSDALIPRVRAMIFVDLDDFKLFNDAHGHLLGDAALESFCEAARGILRESDVIGRGGQGDEFVIWMSGVSEEELRKVLWMKRTDDKQQAGIFDQIRTRMVELLREKTGKEIRFDFTAGIVIRAMSDQEKAEEVYLAMYQQADADMSLRKKEKRVGR